MPYAPSQAIALAALVEALAACAHSPHSQFNAPAPASEALQRDADPAVASGGTARGGSHDDWGLARGATAPNARPDEVGLASWYGDALKGRKTANGERFDPRTMTAAHRHLPFGTWVEVRRVDTGRSVRVRINDRGPFGDGRKVVDVSRAAAERLDMVRDGVVRVEVRVVGGP